MLCKVGIYEPGLKEPAVMPPWAQPLSTNMQNWERLCTGAVYVGDDEPVTGLTLDPWGHQGVWVDQNGRSYGYYHIHGRCWDIVKRYETEILKATGCATLCQGLQLLLRVLGGHFCPRDTDCKDTPRLIRRIGSNGSYNICSHYVEYWVQPFDQISQYMGQACQYEDLLRSGLSIPSDDDVTALLKTALEARDWTVPLRDCEHASCAYCCEPRTMEERAHIDVESYQISHHGSKWSKRKQLEHKQKADQLAEYRHQLWLQLVECADRGEDIENLDPAKYAKELVEYGKLYAFERKDAERYK